MRGRPKNAINKNRKCAHRQFKIGFYNLEQHDRVKALRLGLPIPLGRIAAPWGYIYDEKLNLCVPDILALRLLYKSQEYLKSCSIQTIVDWLYGATRYPLSGEGYRNIVDNRFPFDEIMLSDDERERVYKGATDFVAIAHKKASYKGKKETKESSETAT